MTRGERRRAVVAPAGTWIDWWDATPYTSDGHAPIAIDAPLDKLPLVLRDGAIVPMLRPTIDTLATAEDPNVDSFARDPGLLWVRVAPGRPRRFDLFDYSSIERTADGALSVTSGSVFTRGFVLESMVTSEPRDILRIDAAGAKTTLDRRASLESLSSPDSGESGWFWEPVRRGTLWIKIPAGAARVVVR